jgi:hypothetical protein
MPSWVLADGIDALSSGQRLEQFHTVLVARNG